MSLCRLYRTALEKVSEGPLYPTHEKKVARRFYPFAMLEVNIATMCLIIFAYQSDPRFPLVVAANRDELYTRPSAQADLWTDENSRVELLSGRDLLAGGTWLGVTQQGRFAAVTNIRDPSLTEPKPRSRGDLTRQFLAGDATPEQYCAQLSQNYEQFAGYNLLVGDRNSLFYVNNQEEKVWKLEAGYYGLSNGLLNTSWPKVVQGKGRLRSLIESPEEITTDALIRMMADRTPAVDADLPNTGIEIKLERNLSSAFILNPQRNYGTLCSTAVIFERAGKIRFSEQNFNSNGHKTQGHSFQLPAS
ncbi:MAG: NRDE family protein [Pseudohongiellaceae bacterium]